MHGEESPIKDQTTCSHGVHTLKLQRPGFQGEVEWILKTRQLERGMMMFLPFPFVALLYVLLRLKNQEK